jgi:hypothetical protein
MLRVSYNALLACVWDATSVVCFVGLSGSDSQQPQPQPQLSATSIPSSNYSVGFSLSSSYGAAAVIIDDAHGDKQTSTWQVYGDLAYRKVMARLSLESSRHLA